MTMFNLPQQDEVIASFCLEVFNFCGGHSAALYVRADL
jgi:hypothetical protein